MMSKDPKWHTSLYNHVYFIKDKPLISNGDFKKLYDSVKSGNTCEYKSYTDIYTLSPHQIKIIEDIIFNRIV